MLDDERGYRAYVRGFQLTWIIPLYIKITPLSEEKDSRHRYYSIERHLYWKIGVFHAYMSLSYNA